MTSSSLFSAAHTIGASKHSAAIEPPLPAPHEAHRICVPTELPSPLAAFLDLIAVHVAVGGPAVEDEVRMREANNPYFAFLRAPWHDPAAVYYRWRLYSLLQGDSLQQWRTAPFVMEVVGHGSGAGGPSVPPPGVHAPFVWVPPPMPLARPSKPVAGSTVASPVPEGSVVVPSSVAPLSAESAAVPIAAATNVYAESDAVHRSNPSIRSVTAIATASFSAAMTAGIPPTGQQQQPPLPAAARAIVAKKERSSAVAAFRSGTAEMRRATASVLNVAAASAKPLPVAPPVASSFASGGHLSSLLEGLGGGGNGSDGFAVPDLPSLGGGGRRPLGGLGVSGTPQQQPGGSNKEESVDRSDDLLEVTSEEATVLMSSLYNLHAPLTHPTVATAPPSSSSPAGLCSAAVPVPFLPTPSPLSSSPAPYFYLQQQQPNADATATTTSALDAPTPVASEALPSAPWLSVSSTQRDKHLFTYLPTADADLVSGAALPEAAVVAVMAAVGSSAAPLPTAAAASPTMAHPLTQYATSNLNTLGRVRSAALLYALRRARRYAKHHGGGGGNTAQQQNSSSSSKGFAFPPPSARFAEYAAMVSGDAIADIVSVLFPPPGVAAAAAISAPPSFGGEDDGAEEEANGIASELARLRVVVARRFNDALAATTAAHTSEQQQQQSSSANPLSPLGVADAAAFVGAAYGHLFATDDLPSVATKAKAAANEGLQRGEDAAFDSNPAAAEDLQKAIDTQRLHSALLQRALLDASFIGDASSLLLRHHRSAPHVASLLLDEAARVGRVPADVIRTIRLLGGPLVLQSAEAKTIAALLDAQQKEKSEGGVSSSPSHVARLHRAVALLAALPHRLVAAQTYALQSLLFIANDWLLSAATTTPQSAARAAAAGVTAEAIGGVSAQPHHNSHHHHNQHGHHGQHHHQSSASIPIGLGVGAWVELSEVPPSAAAPAGAAIAEKILAAPLPPFDTSAVPPGALSAAAVASQRAAHDRRHHLLAAGAVAQLSLPRPRVVAAVEMILPSLIEVIGAYILSVAALFPSSATSSAASTTAYNNSDPMSVGGRLTAVLSANEAPSCDDSSSSSSSLLFLAAQLMVWLRTLLAEWVARRCYTHRRYQALLLKYPFLAASQQ